MFLNVSTVSPRQIRHLAGRLFQAVVEVVYVRRIVRWKQSGHGLPPKNDHQYPACVCQILRDNVLYRSTTDIHTDKLTTGPSVSPWLVSSAARHRSVEPQRSPIDWCPPSVTGQLLRSPCGSRRSSVHHLAHRKRTVRELPSGIPGRSSQQTPGSAVYNTCHSKSSVLYIPCKPDSRVLLFIGYGYLADLATIKYTHIHTLHSLKQSATWRLGVTIASTELIQVEAENDFLSNNEHHLTKGLVTANINNYERQQSEEWNILELKHTAVVTLANENTQLCEWLRC